MCTERPKEAVYGRPSMQGRTHWRLKSAGPTVGVRRSKPNVTQQGRITTLWGAYLKAMQTGLKCSTKIALAVRRPLGNWIEWIQFLIAVTQPRGHILQYPPGESENEGELVSFRYEGLFHHSKDIRAPLWWPRRGQYNIVKIISNIAFESAKKNSVDRATSTICSQSTSKCPDSKPIVVGVTDRKCFLRKNFRDREDL